jgi:hypothetical protein
MKMKTILTLCSIALTLPACMHNQGMMHKPLANYERTSSSTDRNGTTTERQTSSRVMTDQYGNRSAVITSKTTENPKGLFNRRTLNQSRQVIEE